MKIKKKKTSQGEIQAEKDRIKIAKLEKPAK